MTKLEEYTGKAAASLAAAEDAKTERDRAFHHRAHAIWRKLIRGIGEAEDRVQALPDAKPARERPNARSEAKPADDRMSVFKTLTKPR